MKKLLEYTGGEKVDLFLFVKKVTKATATSGKPYLTLVLQDKSGELEGRLWDVFPGAEESFIPEAVVNVIGEIQIYRGKAQLKIGKIRLKKESETVPLSELLPIAPMTKEELKDKVNLFVSEMDNSNIKQITVTLLKKYSEDFLTYPAATKNHHEYLSGLAFHVASMLDIAKSLANLYPTLDRNLLYAGIILHDLGKVIELSGSIATTYTPVGNLVGHISIMANEIGIIATELGIDAEDVMLLQHLVLSHHGKGEWGSPKVPMLREAEILFYIDNIDAKMNMMDRALEYVEPGTFSEKVFALENRMFYKPKATNPNPVN